MTLFKNIHLFLSLSLCLALSGQAQPKAPIPSAPTSLDLSNPYSILLLDMVGVLYAGKTSLPGAQTAVQHHLKERTVILLSNNPRPGILAEKKLEKMGFPKGLNVFTSGDATRYYLEKNHQGQKIYHLGQHKNTDLLQGMHIQRVETLEEADLVILSLFTEEAEDDQTFIEELKKIARSSLPVLCSNPDITAPFGATTRKTAGHYAKILEDLGKNVIYMGKPHPFIYELIWGKYQLTEQDKKKALMVGDTVETDIKGANIFGIDSLLVLTGNTAQKIPENRPVQEYLTGLSSAFRPTFYANRL